MNKKLILALIFMLGLGLRLYSVNSLPSILNRDEAALAYNALLLKETGKDEWGRSWPIALESFGDYKLIGYPLALITSFSLFGYSDFAVRVPSVIAGSLLVLVGYWWARSLRFSVTGSLLVSLIIAVTPVFWFYSRMAFEANLALLMFTLAVGLVWFGVQHRPWWLTDTLAVGLMLVAVFTYNTPLLLLPFMVVTVPLIRGLKQLRAWILPVSGWVLVGVVAAQVLLPLSAQKSSITLFSDETTLTQAGVYRQQFTGLAQKTLGHRLAYLGLLTSKNFFASFTPSFLVTKGGSHPWHQLPVSGHMYWTVYVLSLLGGGWVIIDLKRKKLRLIQHQRIVKWLESKFAAGWFNRNWLLVYMLIVSLIPASITVDAPHATRSLLAFFALSILSLILVEKSARKKMSLKPYLIVATLVGLEATHYGWLYFHEYPQQQGAFQPGLAQVLQEVEMKYPGQAVAFVDGGGYDYILTAWYLKLSPSDFFTTVVKQQPDRIGFKYGEKVGKYHFIAKAADRKPEEPVLIEWNNQELKWVVKYNELSL
jgi:hypothetical protein